MCSQLVTALKACVSQLKSAYSQENRPMSMIFTPKQQIIVSKTSDQILSQMFDHI